MTKDPAEPARDLEPAANAGGILDAGDEVIEAELVEESDGSDETDEGEPAASSGLSRGLKVVLWVAGVVVAGHLLVALFLIGMRIPGDSAPMPTPTPTSTPTAAPTPTSIPVGPIEPGVHRWDALLGGECIDPYESAWQDEYTVVDCFQPHPAQVIRGTFADAPEAAYPGFEQLGTRMNLLCTAPTAIDYGVAGGFADILVEASFALDAADWDAGNRTYFCFLSRSSGEPFTTSIVAQQ